MAERKAGELTDEEILIAWASSRDELKAQRAIATAAARKALTEHWVKPREESTRPGPDDFTDGWNACLEAIYKEIPDA